MADRLTARDVQRALYAHFSDRYAVVFEVTARAHECDAPRSRRIDVLLVRRAPKTTPTAKKQLTAAAGVLAAGLGQVSVLGGDSLFDLPTPAPVEEGDDGGLEVVAAEIKVTRADFLADVRDPAKQQPWREMAHRHAYVVPAGLVAVSEVPAGSGLLVVGPADRFYPVSWARRAPRVQTPRPLPLAVQLDAFYRWSRAEAAAKGLAGAAALNDADALRLELQRVKHRLELAAGLNDRLREQADAWRQRLAAFEPLPCATCGQGLRPGRPTKSDMGATWVHGPADAEACLRVRTAAAQAQHDADVAEAVAEGKQGRTLEWMTSRPLYVHPPFPRYPEDE